MTKTLAYLLDGKIYINLTNRCTNSCIFCLRNDKDDVCGKNMWLESETITSNEVIEQIEELPLSEEITFCGYGEPLLKLDLLKEIAVYLKKTYPNIKLRINTNGHANFVHKKDVAQELTGLIDTISVSLNGCCEEEYDRLSQPSFKNAYDEVKQFIKSSANAGINTIATVVNGYKGQQLDIEKCEKIATELGAKFRVREWIENGYS